MLFGAVVLVSSACTSVITPSAAQVGADGGAVEQPLPGGTAATTPAQPEEMPQARPTLTVSEELAREFTRVGEIVWSRVDGALGEIPECCVQAHPDGGYFAMDGATMLHSPDGISWFSEAAPVALMGHRTTGFAVGNEVWATAAVRPFGAGADRLFMQNDTRRWSEANLLAPRSLPVRGIDWRPLDVRPVGAVDGTTLVVGKMLARIPWEDYYGTVVPDRSSLQQATTPSLPRSGYTAETGTITVYDPINGGVMASVGVEISEDVATTLSFVDETSGALLVDVTVAAGNEDAVASLVRGAPVVRDVLWVGSASDGFLPAATPWNSSSAVIVYATAIGPRYLVIVDDLGDVSMWTSGDGTQWKREATPPFFAGTASVDLIKVGEGMLANVVTELDRGIDLSTWTSSDGVHWSQAHRAMPRGETTAAAFGFVMIREDIIERGRWQDLVRELRVSSDGMVWDDIELPWGANFASVSTSVVDHAIFLIMDDGYRRIMWVGLVA